MSNFEQMPLHELARQWKYAKMNENDAIEHRRKLEDAIVVLLAIPADRKGTSTFTDGDAEVKIVSKLYDKVDAKKLEALAVEYGMLGSMYKLFRKSYEINAKEWANAHEFTKQIFCDAITTTPGRHSISISIKE